ncbi:hypothetical protein, partial [Vibrio parahaemolyticus]|uniref:hypothetical protein n=1 Tax=Vibrio parahaemolyticus TaxID=670 RepID=UPI001C5E2E55
FRHLKSRSNLLAISLFAFLKEIGVAVFRGASFGELINPINNKQPKTIPIQCAMLSFLTDLPQLGHFLCDLDTCFP